MCETNFVHIDQRIQKKKKKKEEYRIPTLEKRQKGVKAWAGLHLVELFNLSRDKSLSFFKEQEKKSV